MKKLSRPGTCSFNGKPLSWIIDLCRATMVTAEVKKLNRSEISSTNGTPQFWLIHLCSVKMALLVVEQMTEAVLIISHFRLNQQSDRQGSPVYHGLFCIAGLSDKRMTVSGQASDAEPHRASQYTSPWRLLL